MAYADNASKFVAVINRKHPAPVVLNALAHTAFGLSGIAGVGNLLEYQNVACDFAAKIDESPFIILEAKNSNQLRVLLSNVKEASSTSIAYNVFTTSMIGASAAAQMEATRTALDEALDFVVVVIFGAREAVEALTKRFSLFKQ
ncbi:DUF2000 family protein [Burkholderia sp. Bp9017]|uniref:DUF2000 domain-containing protein n=1 Tax=Burkholderia anthina TaxID=179879 RepID=A0A7T6VLM6_9BURK|nr:MULTISPECIES: DUF2000 domain-containing protein [Burkholderia]MBY4868925.1 DUF2000 domain-containing protein [Burkholderia anthina]QQK06193.1 DUF2000 domain-containing protein [Burkholderia anthina]RQZ17964.1 DUF2000 family protein [Burkholderia sp. Bp9017]RQZ28122.1 DUF2000 family protein [Burkholderia sp. Bp9016]